MSIKIRSSQEKKISLKHVLNCNKIHNSWYPIFKELNSELKIIFSALNDISNDNGPITVYDNRIFNVFQMPLDKLKVLFLDTIPSTSFLTLNKGFSLTKMLNVTKEHSDKKTFDVIQECLYRDTNDITVYDLEEDLYLWESQGVFQLQTSLAHTVERLDSLWQPFISQLIRLISEKKKDVVFVYFGKKSYFYTQYITFQNGHTLLMVEKHPRELDIICKYPLSFENVFYNVNNYLKKKGREEIKWF